MLSKHNRIIIVRNLERAGPFSESGEHLDRISQEKMSCIHQRGNVFAPTEGENEYGSVNTDGIAP